MIMPLDKAGNSARVEGDSAVLDPLTSTVIPKVFPAAVTFTDEDGSTQDTYTIPATEGVDYQVAGKTITTGTHKGTGTVTVSAKAKTDYVLAAGATTTWSATFKATPYPVTPAAVVFTDEDGTTQDTYTIPATEGVDYQVAGKTITTGTHKGTGTVTVSAKAKTDYVLAAGATTTWSATFKGMLVGSAPAISGTAKVGKTLTAAPGTWTQGTKLTYQWYASGKAIKGAMKAPFKPTKAQRGKKISVKVAGKKIGYTTVSKSSKSTKAVSR